MQKRRLCPLLCLACLLAACTTGPASTQSAGASSVSQPDTPAKTAASEPETPPIPAWAEEVDFLTHWDFADETRLRLDPDFFGARSDEEKQQAQQALLAGRRPEELEGDERFNYLLLEYYKRPATPFSEKLTGRFEPLYSGNVGESVYIDLNGDGIDDLLLVEKDTERVTTLSVNDSRVSIPNFIEEVYVIDIDPSDPYKEIYLYTWLQVYFYCYDGKELIFMNQDCNVPLIENGVLVESIGSDRVSGLYGVAQAIAVTEDARLQLHITGSTLMSYNHIQEYKLTDGHLLQAVPRDFYPMDVLLMVTDPSLAVYARPDLEAELIGPEDYYFLRVIGTDIVEWAQVELPDGQTGWLHCYNTNTRSRDGSYARHLFYAAFAG